MDCHDCDEIFSKNGEKPQRFPNYTFWNFEEKRVTQNEITAVRITETIFVVGFKS